MMVVFQLKGFITPVDNVMDDPDLLDIRESLSGDGDAYARLVRRHQQTIAAQMWRFSRNRSEVEELVQDVFVEAYVSLKTFKAQAPFLHWLRRIATRVGYRFWKKQARERAKRSDLDESGPGLPSVEQDPTPEKAGELLHLLLARLGPRDRLVLTLQYFEELSTSEIAERTGWTRSLVKVQAHRARKKLKSLLEKEGFQREDL